MEWKIYDVILHHTEEDIDEEGCKDVQFQSCQRGRISRMILCNEQSIYINPDELIQKLEDTTSTEDVSDKKRSDRQKPYDT
ncbi:hypothetical protein DERF_014587 [Dermatophagoides farinae]|uniref:Uncharacterized protein n=1 Tax=Dermatophagoides farinae TaxID=6954 RepID=A0A922KZ96_DERFA|nr:hypothetical protein DERF_014587 [Dermatophagoides farinae]